jgi:hypothetical protein
MNPRGGGLASWFRRVIRFELHVLRRGGNNEICRTERCLLRTFRRSIFALSNRFSFRIWTALSSLLRRAASGSIPLPFAAFLAGSLCCILPVLSVTFSGFPPHTKYG